MVVPGRLWVGLWDRVARIAAYTGVLPSLIRMRSLVQIQVGPPPVGGTCAGKPRRVPKTSEPTL